MAKKTFQKKIIINDYEKIRDFLLGKSASMSEYLEDNPNMDYSLYVKYITHSDLISKGKRNEKSGFERNYLYYLTTEEMIEMEKYDFRNNGVEILGNDRLSKISTNSTAHQSNITVSTHIYDFLGIINKSKEKQTRDLNDNEKQLVVSDYVDVYLVNDCLKYFDIEYTKKIFDKLDKHPNWNYEDYKVDLSQDKFTKIHLTQAAHGFGTSDDVEFQKLRMSIFLNDKLIILVSKDKNGEKKKMFILLDKNPRFFTILGEYNLNWEQYLIKNNGREMFQYMKDNVNVDYDEKSRKYQAKWRKQLAEEMMNFSNNQHEIFCPLTRLTVNFDNAGTLFRASHIKSYEDCTVEEAFDLDNGILMCANADALFDKHLITIGEDGTILFSFLIEQDFKLKSDLQLTQKVFQYILTPKRKEFLKIHNQVFEEKERKRKIGILEEDSSE